MEHNFQNALSAVLKHEGGWADHPKDPGGATMRGVTLGTFRRYVKAGASKADLKNITAAELETVYRRHYWDAVRGNELPSGVDYAVFDFAVNSGPSRATKFLQQVLGIKQDGKLGPVTLAALKDRYPSTIVSELCTLRLKWLRRLKTWKTFGRGWERRVVAVQELASAMTEQGSDNRYAPDTPLDNLSYANQNAIRNLPVTKSLETKISTAINAVFGSGYRAEIYSGGQPRKGSGGKRTGSVHRGRHHAADDAVGAMTLDPLGNRPRRCAV